MALNSGDKQQVENVANNGNGYVDTMGMHHARAEQIRAYEAQLRQQQQEQLAQQRKGWFC